MNIVEIKDRKQSIITVLLQIWESSVKATHLFLTEKEIKSIKQYVPLALQSIPRLIVAENDSVPFKGTGI